MDRQVHLPFPLLLRNRIEPYDPAEAPGSHAAKNGYKNAELRDSIFQQTVGQYWRLSRDAKSHFP